jgi:hypothetical protein
MMEVLPVGVVQVGHKPANTKGKKESDVPSH